MLTFLLTFVYVIVCVFLILVVLLQQGKRADLAGAFGGGGSETAFGPRGAANMLSRLTTISAVLFMLVALLLSILSSGSGGRPASVLDQVETPPASAAPAPAPETPGDAEVPPPQAP